MGLKKHVRMHTRSMISWKWTDTRALSRFLWLLELWMSSETLFSRSCRTQTQSVAMSKQGRCMAAKGCCSCRMQTQAAQCQSKGTA
jgi:hypothetical protein